MTYTHIKREAYIHDTHLDALQRALKEVDAGHINNYDSFLSYYRVTGTCRSLEGADPYIDNVGEIGGEKEIQIEVVIETDRAMETEAATRRVHPYKEPVINLIPLLDVESL